MHVGLPLDRALDIRVQFMLHQRDEELRRLLVVTLRKAQRGVSKRMLTPTLRWCVLMVGRSQHACSFAALLI